MSTAIPSSLMPTTALASATHTGDLWWLYQSGHWRPISAGHESARRMRRSASMPRRSLASGTASPFHTAPSSTTWSSPTVCSKAIAQDGALERGVARLAMVGDLGEIAVGHPDDAIGDLAALDLRPVVLAPRVMPPSPVFWLLSSAVSDMLRSVAAQSHK